MSLRIKEIYQSDLDPNVDSWWSSSKIDKLNYNFSLLSNGGLSGPVGSLGTPGDVGMNGLRGATGHIGSAGHQGMQGPTGLEFWMEGRSAQNLTLFPKFLKTNEYDPVHVGLGHKENEQIATLYKNRLFEVHNHTEAEFTGLTSNIILRSANSIDFHVKLSPVGTSPLIKKIEIGKLDLLPTDMILQYDISSFNYTLGNRNIDDLLTISKTIFKSSHNNNKLDKTQVDGSFIYNNMAMPEALLSAIDNNGNAVWLNNRSLFESFPIGSIVSIPGDVFNDNFNLDFSQTVITEDKTLRNIHGRGKLNSDYEGWYLCNGEIWGDGVINYTTPNLNSFDYSIETEVSGSIVIVEGGDNTPVLIGGSNITMESTYDSDVYTTEFVDPTINSVDVIKLETSVNFDLAIRKNVHIVYLMNTNFFWQANTNPTTPTLSIILLAYGTDSDGACSVDRTEYKWNGGTTNWVSGDFSSIKLYTTGNQLAPSGWYVRDGIARLWNGNTFERIQNCDNLQSIDLAYSTNVINLNINVISNFVAYSIDGTFADANVLLNSSGSLANAGWYRETGTFGRRRYWDGDEFVGETIREDYIYSIGLLETSRSANTNACTIDNDENYIYHATNDSTLIGISDLHKIKNSDGKVLVNLNFTKTNGDNGSYPLVYIKDQPVPGSTSTYLSLVDVIDGGTQRYRGSLNLDSTVDSISSC